MDLQQQLGIFFGIKITWVFIFSTLAASVPILVAFYKFVDRWQHREERRLEMLRLYLDKEEKDISSKRKPILRSIQNSSQSYLTDREFNVGNELDAAVGLLDAGHPEEAAAKLAVLEKRLANNCAILKARAEHLDNHRASVQVFLAALADKAGNSDIGLEHVSQALSRNNSDLDAIKYQSNLYLSRGIPEQAGDSFAKLLRLSNGTQNASYKADAYLGLATVEAKLRPSNFDEILRNLDNSLSNRNRVLPKEQDFYARAQAHRMKGDLHSVTAWAGYDLEVARQSYFKALDALQQIPNKRGKVDFEIQDLQVVLKKYGGPTSADQSQARH